MTVSVQPLTRTPAAHGGPGRLRLAVCLVTIAACVPYLTIKIAWLSGSTIGWNDTSAAQESALYVGNAITMGMDAVAVLVALAFTFRWGRRIPAWLVLTPIWVAVGLLAPIVLAVPLGSLLQVLFSAEPLTGGDQAALQGWVFGAVYGGFTVQGLGLLTAFVLYARDRWADVFAVRTKDVPRGATHPLQVLLARTASVFATAFAVVHLFWAFGGTAGLRPDELDHRNIAQQLADGMWGVLALAGAAALLMIVQRRGRPDRFVVPLAAAWVGAAATFAWSLYGLLVTLAQPGFLASDTTVAANLTALSGLLAGLIMGLTGAVLLTERQSARPIASSTP
ncbi:DUF3995 domain-containing protein [Actinomadura sp. BRA 177]|uniref:DUF3995 domain-containing protein n=1 Tax=Actinomadura sp. BRA 177 TaxID=2745202 RepID=UPI001594F889|nr:DUF3995 domain-containing protein [Actinomadura sp. BRA 177]NVI91616.1 DUF3995 domain-containing protein [Actinomadura sp. BRA 177]